MPLEIITREISKVEDVKRVESCRIESLKQAMWMK